MAVLCTSGGENMYPFRGTSRGHSLQTSSLEWPGSMQGDTAPMAGRGDAALKPSSHDPW